MVRDSILGVEKWIGGDNLHFVPHMFHNGDKSLLCSDENFVSIFFFVRSKNELYIPT